MKDEHPETEINRIRLELYEETKDLTREERTHRSNEQGQRLAVQYGFTIHPNIDTRETNKGTNKVV